jgi:hypothetical protein
LVRQITPEVDDLTQSDTRGAAVGRRGRGLGSVCHGLDADDGGDCGDLEAPPGIAEVLLA